MSGSIIFIVYVYAVMGKLYWRLLVQTADNSTVLFVRTEIIEIKTLSATLQNLTAEQYNIMFLQ